MPPRPQYFHLMSLGILVQVPLVVLTLLMVLFAFAYDRAPGVVWAAVALCYGAALVLMAVRQTREGPRYWFNLGFLCVIATTAAIACGLVNWKRHFSVYAAYEGQRSYTNVLPMEPALSHLDAGKIMFSADAYIDVANAVGYTDGHLYCVAPIMGQSSQPLVEYWAAGVGCCHKAGSFDCDDAGDRAAKGALVYLDRTAHFQKAAKQAQALNGLVAAQDALYVRWVEDPDQAQRAYWNKGVAFMIGVIGIYVAFSLLCGCMLHFRQAPAKMKMAFRDV